MVMEPSAAPSTTTTTSKIRDGCLNYIPDKSVNAVLNPFHLWLTNHSITPTSTPEDLLDHINSSFARAAEIMFFLYEETSELTAQVKCLKETIHKQQDEIQQLRTHTSTTTSSQGQEELSLPAVILDHQKQIDEVRIDTRKDNLII